jgi:hypothetical protein
MFTCFLIKRNIRVFLRKGIKEYKSLKTEKEEEEATGQAFQERRA